MKRLRIGLPPLDQLTAQSQVRFAWLERGVVVNEGCESLAQLGKTRAAMECFLHPRDSLLTCLELPPLPAAKTTAAVACAAQALILGPVEQMHVAHGPRESDGRVQVAWVPKAGLEQLAQLQLKLRGLYPAPYALPVGAAALDEGYLLTRDSLQQGAVHPLGLQALDVPLVDAAMRWSGPTPAWGLHGRLSQPASGGWGRALGCVALATAIWTLGLNLYAARQVDEGQRLKALMGAKYETLLKNLQAVGPLEADDGMLRVSGNRQHMGGEEVAAVVIDPARNGLRVWLLSEGKNQVFTDVDGADIPWPAGVQAMIKNVQQAPAS